MYVIWYPLAMASGVPKVIDKLNASANSVLEKKPGSISKFRAKLKALPQKWKLIFTLLASGAIISSALYVKPSASKKLQSIAEVIRSIYYYPTVNIGGGRIERQRKGTRMQNSQNAGWEGARLPEAYTTSFHRRPKYGPSSFEGLFNEKKNLVKIE
jgi:hypothetical protein